MNGGCRNSSLLIPSSVSWAPGAVEEKAFIPLAAPHCSAHKEWELDYSIPPKQAREWASAGSPLSVDSPEGVSPNGHLHVFPSAWMPHIMFPSSLLPNCLCSLDHSLHPAPRVTHSWSCFTCCARHFPKLGVYFKISSEDFWAPGDLETSQQAFSCYC